MYNAFQEVDESQTGRIKYSDFLSVLEVEDSLVAQKIFEFLDFDDKGSVEKKDLVISLSNFSNAKRLEKLKFGFLIIDEQGNDAINKKDLLKFLRINLSDMLSTEVAFRAVKIFELAEEDPENPKAQISYEKFMSIAKSSGHLFFPGTKNIK